MSSSKSNISNESSRSNLLTLSQDSQSSELKSHRANIYYKKFISKLGFLFRIDTQDLDALYNKIAQCLQEGQGLSQSDDADINELIQMAKQLQYNHSLLKNMVEILDRRFLKKSHIQQNDVNRSQKYAQSLNLTPESKKLQKQVTHSATPMTIKNKYQSNTEGKDFELKNNFQSTDQISGLFNNTLQQARNEMRRKKQQQISKKRQDTDHLHPNSNTSGSLSQNQNIKSIINLSGSKYEGRVQKIFQEMNKIKSQLSKMQQTSQYSNNESISSDIMGTQLANGSTTQSLPSQMKNRYESNQSHQTFKQVEQDTYFLVDDRFIKQQQQPTASVPKLSLKQLYAKMGMGSDDENEEHNQKGMGVIRETSRQSDNQLQNSKQQFYISHQGYNLNEEKGNTQSLQINKESSEESMIKTKSVNISTSADNVTLHNSEHNMQKQAKKNYFQPQNIFESKNLQHQHFNEGQSQKSLQGSNATFIQKLNYYQTVNPSRKNTNTSIIENIYFAHNEEETGSHKKGQAYGSVQTTTMVHSSSLPEFEVGRDGKDFNEQKLYAQRDTNQDIFMRGEEKNQHNIHGYLQRLEERNKKLKKYVSQIELNINKQKQLRQQIQMKSKQGKSLVASSSKTLTNLVYTDNEIITPKYVPNTLKPGETKFKDMKVKTEETRLSNFEQKQDERKINRAYLEQNSYFDISQSNNNFHKSSEKTFVPYLANLMENGDKSVQNKQGSNTKLKSLKNNLYMSKEHQQNQNTSTFQKETNSKQNMNNKFKQDILQHQDSHHGESSFKNIEIESKDSLNSIQDRMEHKNLHLGRSQDNSKKIVIPRSSNKSLFDQTRNVQSKIELSQDRTFKIRVPGQEIQKIKDRVNQMFKKIKSIKEDTTNFIKQSSEASNLHQNLQSTQKVPDNISQQKKYEGQIKKFQFKVPQQKMNVKNQQQGKKSSFIDRIESSKRLIQDPYLNSSSTTPVHFTYGHEEHMKSSVVLDKCVGGADKAKASFMNDQNKSNRSRQNSMGQAIQNKTNLLNSRQSNFSFRNPIPNKFGQDSIRSSVTGSYQHNERFSRAQSASSSQEKKVMLTQSIPIHRNIVINPVLINKPPSTRSSSNESKNSLTKSIPVGPRPIMIPLRNSPPLPPMRPQRNLPLVNNNYGSPKNIPTNMIAKSIQRRNSSYLSNEKRVIPSPVPSLNNIVPRVIPESNRNPRPFPAQKIYEGMNYSTVIPYQNFVQNPIRQRHFDPPHIVSVSINPAQRFTPKQLKIPQSNETRRSKTQIVRGSENSIAINSDIYLRGSNNSHSRSKSRSGSKSKKGIKVVSQKPRKIEKQQEFSYF